MSMQISYKKQITLMILLFLVLLIGVEIILRAYDYFNPRCDFLVNPLSKNLDYELKKQICDMWRNHLVYIDPQSGISQIKPNQHFASININNDGFRGPEILHEDEENTYRIFIVGGSTIFAIRAPSDNDTIPGYIQKSFDEMNLEKQVEVINAGIDAVTSSDELQLIKTKLVKFDPDLIIVFDGHNDIANPPGKTKPKIFDDVFSEIYKKYFSFYNTPFVIGGIIENAKSPVQTLFYDDNQKEKAIIWKNNMISICELGKQEGFETLVVLQPFLGTGNKSLTVNEKENYDKYFREKLVQGYQLFADELNDLENYCDKTADLRNIFDVVKGDVYFDEVHVDSKSNKLLADRIFDLALPKVK